MIKLEVTYAYSTKQVEYFQLRYERKKTVGREKCFSRLVRNYISSSITPPPVKSAIKLSKNIHQKRYQTGWKLRQLFTQYNFKGGQQYGGMPHLTGEREKLIEPKLSPYFNILTISSTMQYHKIWHVEIDYECMHSFNFLCSFFYSWLSSARRKYLMHAYIFAQLS